MADRSKSRSKSRARLIELKAKMDRKGATPDEIVTAMLEKYPEIFRAEKDELARYGLKTMLNSICNLNGGSGSSVQPDLFAGYDVPFTVTVRDQSKDGDVRKVKKNLATISKRQLREYIESRTKAAAPKTSSRKLEMLRLYDSIKNEGTDDWSVEACLEAVNKKRRKA